MGGSHLVSDTSGKNYGVFLALVEGDPEVKGVVMSEYPELLGSAPSPHARDKAALRDHTEHMNDITRPELDAKLSATEARMDARVVAIEGKIDAFLTAQAERDKRFEQELELNRQQSEKQFQQMDQRFQRMDTSISDIKSSLSAQKYWLAGIGVAVILGIMGANATIFSGAKSFFDGGVEQSEIRALIEDLKAQSAETRALIERRDIAPLSSAPSTAAPNTTTRPPEYPPAE